MQLQSTSAGTAEQTVVVKSDWEQQGAKQHLGLKYFSNIQPKQLTTCEAVLAAYTISYVL